MLGTARILQQLSDRNSMAIYARIRPLIQTAGRGGAVPRQGGLLSSISFSPGYAQRHTKNDDLFRAFGDPGGSELNHLRS